MSPDTVRERGLLPPGFMPLPHVKQATGGQVFPTNQIATIQNEEARNLRRFDVDFDLPDHASGHVCCSNTLHNEKLAIAFALVFEQLPELLKRPHYQADEGRAAMLRAKSDVATLTASSAAKASAAKTLRVRPARRSVETVRQYRTSAIAAADR
jgi:hypothetical protein